MAKASVYSTKKKKKSKVTLPDEFNEKENMYLLAQAVRVYHDRKKPIRGKTKSRGEVVASKRKIWRQKGTGRARHGAVSAPIFVGGGQAHGPRGVKRELNLPKKMKRKALSVALSMKVKDGGFAVIDDVSKIKKTKEAQNLLNEIVKKELKGKEPNRITVAFSNDNKDAKKYFRNIENVIIESFEDLNAFKVFYGGLIVVDKDVLKKKKKESKK